MSLLADACESPLPLDRQNEIIRRLWPRYHDNPLSARELESWQVYFQHYTAELRSAIKCESGAYTTIRQHGDIVAIAEELEKGFCKEAIKRRLYGLDTQNRTTEEKEQMAEGSLRLVVRLLSMVDIGPISRNRVPSLTSVSWLDESSELSTALGQYFDKSSEDPGKFKFDTKFSAYNIERLAGIEILWTNNLADHLRLVEDSTKLWVFHHTTFLRRQNG